MADGIAFTIQRHTGIITLDRPQSLNALSLEMILALKEQLSLWQADDKVHAVIIQAAPGKAFCAGGDVRWLYEMGRTNRAHQLDFFAHEYALNALIHHYPKPYIALMDGITMGGGVGISLHGQFPIASEHFSFAMPETTIGFFPDIGASHLLAACPMNMGVYLGLTGHRLTAHEARALNLVHAVVPSSHFPRLLDDLIGLDVTKDATSCIRACIASYAEKKQVLPPSWQAYQRCFSKESVEAILDALHAEQDPHMHAVADELSKKSPLSLKVTLRQLQKAQGLSLDACLNMDTILVHHFMNGADFYEGIRALLIDKDKSPHWEPSCLREVSDEAVNAYFWRY